MGKFIVQVREVHVVSYEVEATSALEAADWLEDSRGDAGVEKGIEYSHTLDRDTWTAYEVGNENEGYIKDLTRRAK
jgi:hypothetical protein